MKKKTTKVAVLVCSLLLLLFLTGSAYNTPQGVPYTGAGQSVDLGDNNLTATDLIIEDAGNIGSDSDADAIAIAADGKTTFTQDMSVSGSITVPTANIEASSGDISAKDGGDLFAYSAGSDKWCKIFNDDTNSWVTTSAGMLVCGNTSFRTKVQGIGASLDCNNIFTMQTAADASIFLRLGGEFRIEDRDAASALRVMIDSATGDYTSALGNLTLSAGDLSVGGTATLSGIVSADDIYPIADDTHYLGKNDDDSPFAWKGIILKDTSDGKYYRIQVTNGALEAIDLTD